MLKRGMKLCAGAMALMLAVATTVRAAPLDDRVPASSVFYWGWAGANALTPQYNQSNLKGIIDASSIQKFVQTMLPKLIEQAGQNDPSAPQMIAKVQAGLQIAWQHPVAVYFCPIDFSAKIPAFRAGIICDAGADAKQLTDLLTEALKNAPPPEGGNTFKVNEQNGTVLLSIGQPQTLAELKAGGVLSASPEYVKAMGQVKMNGPSAGAVYLDFSKVLANVENALAQSPDVPPEVRTKAGGVIDMLGVRGLTQMAVQSGFDGKGWSDKAFLGIKGQRTGLLAMLDAGPLSDGALAMVPKDAVAFSANKFDLNKLYNEAKSVVGTIDEQALRQMEDGVRQVNQLVGFDIEADLIATLGDEWVVYRAPMSDSGMGMALVSKLKNADKFAATLATIEKLYNDRSGLPIKVEKVKAGKTEVSAILFLTYNVCWTVHNGNLFISTLDGMPSAIAQVDDKAPAITANPLYQNVMKMVPAGVKPASISYANPAKLYPDLRKLVMGLIPMARGQGVDIPMDLLPDISAVGEFMTPGGTVGWSDADGMHAVGTSAFPGAAILSGQQGGPAVVALAGVGTGLLFASPVALAQRTQVQAAPVTDAANLRSLSMGCMVYAADHNNTMPDHIAQLLLDGQISPRALVNDRSGTAPMNMTPEMEAMAKNNFPAFAKEVEGHCDYIYVGNGVKASQAKNAAQFAVMYQNPAVADRTGANGINIAFLDGHVEFVRWGAVAGKFQETLNYQSENKLPPLDITGLNQRDIMRSAGAAVEARPDPLP